MNIFFWRTPSVPASLCLLSVISVGVTITRVPVCSRMAALEASRIQGYLATDLHSPRRRSPKLFSQGGRSNATCSTNRKETSSGMVAWYHRMLYMPWTLLHNVTLHGILSHFLYS